MGARPKPKITTILLLGSGLIFLLFAAAIGFLVRDNLRRLSLEKAHQEAELLLNHNLAIHDYFNRQMKPVILPLVQKELAAGYFEPIWMSSTCAVRQIQQSAQGDVPPEYYYKECAINARSPENEADDAERDFLLRLNRDPLLQEETAVRRFDGTDYLVTMRRGETMGADCLLCHSSPGQAPKGLVARYGDQRSFHRQVGETISAVSIRVPLAEAYAATGSFSWQLSGVLILAAGLLLAAKHRLYHRLLLQPILTIRDQARRIAGDESRLGERLPPLRGRELDELAEAFNDMSAQLARHRDQLEGRVEERTAELHRALGELRASEGRYRALNRSMIQPLALHEIICDAAGTPVDYRFLDVNPAFERLLGLEAAAIVGRTVRELLPATEAHWIDTYGKVALGGEPLHFEDYSGELDRTFDVVAFSPEPRQFAVIATDISEQVRMREERRRLDEQLHHAQKLESLGVLAGGIAHDFNNILMAVIGNADLALLRLPAGSPAADNLRQIETAAGKAADLARQMLAFSGKGRFVVEPLDLNSFIAELLPLLKVSIGKQAVLRCDYSRPLPVVEADATQLRQVLTNLVINAAEALGEAGGAIAVATGAMDCDRAFLQGARLDGDLPEGNYVFFEVADTGCGMDLNTLNHLFDPFFTTKFTGRGLGMAAVQGIVRGHRGTITVASEVGRGSTFRVFLPASASSATPSDVLGTDTAWRGSGTVLLVDDEETVRAVGTAMLRELGFKVLTAADGREALEVFRRERETICGVLMDLTMPHMDGEEAFRELRRLDPTVRIIMTSGFNEQEVAQKFLGQGLSGFLQKPFRVSTLSAALQMSGLKPGRA